MYYFNFNIAMLLKIFKSLIFDCIFKGDEGNLLIMKKRIRV